VTEFRTALALLPPTAGTEPAYDAFDAWLHAAGWDTDRLELRPSPDHETLGYRVCAVETCDRPTWGRANQGLCSGCDAAWRRRGRPDRRTFDRQPPHRFRQHHAERCSVMRNGEQCPRPARHNGLCRAHTYVVSKSSCDPAVVLATLDMSGVSLRPGGRDVNLPSLCRAYRSLAQAV
jgi:hypothetical protein